MILKKHHILALILIFIAPFFFVGGPGFESARSINELWNIGHIVFFALLSTGLYEYWLPAAFSSLKKIVLIFFIIVVLGMGIEVVQLAIDGRSVGWDDGARDLVGGAFVLLWQIGTNRKTLSQCIVLRVLAIGIVAVPCLPLWLVLADEYRAREEFPMLSGFEQEADLGRWRGKESLRLVTSPVRQGKAAAELRLGVGEHSGIYLFYCPEDWRGKNALAFSVYNPGAPLELNFRVLDHLRSDEKRKYHHQYNGSTVLLTGWNDILILTDTIKDQSVGGEMDLAHIWAFGVFILEPQENRILYLDDVRLL